MTENEWLVCEDPDRMVFILRGRGPDRKFRLFSCACCRRIWHLLDPSISGSVLDVHPRTIVEVAELYADGRADESERQAAQGRFSSIEGWHPGGSACNAAQLTIPLSADVSAAVCAKQAVRAASGPVPDNPDVVLPNNHEIEAAERIAQAQIVRDIFGNPFRPVAFDPAWRTSDAVALARAMYESRDFGAMPILADALQDAGCDRADVLTHCRAANQVHVRGCWVCDLVLGKE